MTAYVVSFVVCARTRHHSACVLDAPMTIMSNGETETEARRLVGGPQRALRRQRHPSRGRPRTSHAPHGLMPPACLHNHARRGASLSDGCATCSCHIRAWDDCVQVNVPLDVSHVPRVPWDIHWTSHVSHWTAIGVSRVPRGRECVTCFPWSVPRLINY